MRSTMGILILLTAAIVCFGGRQARAQAQACQDEEEMFKTSLKDVSDLVDAVKKETITDFESHYHQKSYLSKATFLLTMVGALVDCLAKASQDSSASKDQVQSYKTKQELYSKLKGRFEQEKNAVKSTEDAKKSKTLIEKIDLST
jgi:hypothetical protein